MSNNTMTMTNQFLTLVLAVLSIVVAVSASTTHTTSSSSSSSDNSTSNSIPTPTITIGKDRNGVAVQMPLLGAGTWQYNDTTAYQSVCRAVEAGYTLIDTAYGYQNQVGVGLALNDCWFGSATATAAVRDDLFVLTKVPGGLSYEATMAAHYQNLWELQLDYTDHLMVHFPSDWQQHNTGKHQRQEQWRALEQLYQLGKTRSIGISHYCSQHIDDILEIATIRPTLNQVEYHVGSHDVDDVIQKCTRENIYFMSFSPLCGPCQYQPEDSLVNGNLVQDIASHYPNKTGAQVALRFIVQQALEGRVTMAGVIPKSNNPKHIATNQDIFDFTLTQEDMQRLEDAVKPPGEPGDCNVP